MATTKFANRARMLTSTTGTGTSVALTTAVDGYFTLAEAGLQDGDVVDYIIEQGADFEIQHDQTYSSSGPSLSRGTPAASKVGGTAGTSKINLNGSAQVAIVGLAKSFDINTFTAKATPATDDVLWGHSTADGARRAIPVSGILNLVPPPPLSVIAYAYVSNPNPLSVAFSSGITISRTGTGNFTATFTSPRSAVDYIVMGSSIDEEISRTPAFQNLSTTGFTITVRVIATGNPIDMPFQIIVFG